MTAFGDFGYVVYVGGTTRLLLVMVLDPWAITSASYVTAWVGDTRCHKRKYLIVEICLLDRLGSKCSVRTRRE